MISDGEINMLKLWDGKYKPNKSNKCKKLKAKLEENGHTNVFVWYESLGPAMDKCGCSGGYMYTSDQVVIEPLGYPFEYSMKMLDKSWHKV